MTCRALVFVLTFALCVPLFPRAAHAGYAVKIDEEYSVNVESQGSNIWIANGGLASAEKDSDPWVEYRRKRAIEISSHCRIERVLSDKGASTLKAKVNRCYN